ncbi:hypothetical protein L6164_014199 [Bauhinia variegata]|uniref:Uncharacterized protein n=1 Tax=Bauhinia variegata TaxID=167791 RepID=A0ACB9NGE9_BAUVA|nr:hypothetical protein L6164_014199 [Bauhinia variegata]
MQCHQCCQLRFHYDEREISSGSKLALKGGGGGGGFLVIKVNESFSFGINELRDSIFTEFFGSHGQKRFWDPVVWDHGPCLSLYPTLLKLGRLTWALRLFCIFSALNHVEQNKCGQILPTCK